MEFLMIKRLKTSGVLLSLQLVFCTSLLAQLGDDPTTIPLPEFGVQNPHRAVVVDVQFNSPTNVALLEVLVSNTRAPSSVGAPPHVLLELLDHNGNVIATQNAWHPLWERQWDESGTTESGSVEDSGRGTFYVPLSETLSEVRISDIELDLVLLTVDVQSEVAAYCAATKGTPICALYLNGFEGL